MKNWMRVYLGALVSAHSDKQNQARGNGHLDHNTLHGRCQPDADVENFEFPEAYFNPQCRKV